MSNPITIYRDYYLVPCRDWLRNLKTSISNRISEILPEEPEPIELEAEVESPTPATIPVEQPNFPIEKITPPEDITEEEPVTPSVTTPPIEVTPPPPPIDEPNLIITFGDPEPKPSVNCNDLANYPDRYSRETINRCNEVCPTEPDPSQCKLEFQQRKRN